MDITSTSFIVLLLGDEHGSEVPQRGQNRTTHPRRILSLRRVEYIDFHRRWCQCYHLLV